MSTTTHLTTSEQSKAQLIEKAIALAKSGKGTGGPPHDQVGDLLRAYYRHVAPEDLADRSEVDLYGAFAAHYKLAADRPQGTAKAKLTTPTLADQGWSAAGHSVVEVVVDDMPFLVDSLTMELSRQLRDVHVVVHPNFDVVRDITGVLQSLVPVSDGALEPEGEAVRESWMHVEIDRLPEGEDAAAIVDDIQRVLRDVREAVEDWRKMHSQVEAIVAGSSPSGSRSISTCIHDSRTASSSGSSAPSGTGESDWRTPVMSRTTSKLGCTTTCTSRS